MFGLNALRELIMSREFQMLAIILLFLLWIGGMVYCERVADEQEWNQWLARGASIFLPGLGPLIYWYLRRRRRRRG